MKDIDIHFRQTRDNEYLLIYNQESFVDTVIRRELEME